MMLDLIDPLFISPLQKEIRRRNLLLRLFYVAHDAHGVNSWEDRGRWTCDENYDGRSEGNVLKWFHPYGIEDEAAPLLSVESRGERRKTGITWGPKISTRRICSSTRRRARGLSARTLIQVSPSQFRELFRLGPFALTRHHRVNASSSSKKDDPKAYVDATTSALRKPHVADGVAGVATPTDTKAWQREYLPALWTVLQSYNPDSATVANTREERTYDKSESESEMHGGRINMEQPHRLGSFLRLKHEPFIVPGGRFQEIYYWDSYWIIKGLLLSGMRDVSKNIILNLLDLVARFGFVPNGTRLYYLSRSQPPFLASMVHAYLGEEIAIDDRPLWKRIIESVRQGAKTDEEIVTHAFPLLEAEYRWWMENRAYEVRIEGKNHVLNHYDSDSNVARPESFPFDRVCPRSIIACCESGWDFSSRWGPDADGNWATPFILPCDLQAILHRYELILGSLSLHLGLPSKSQRYFDAAASRRQAVQTILRAPEGSAWRDFDVRSRSQRQGGYASDFTPLWGGLAHKEDAIEAEQNLGALRVKEGITTSLYDTAHQWDYPNLWAPLQDLIGAGFELYGLSTGAEIRQAFIAHCFDVFQTTGAMFEKYAAGETNKGVGFGGEYDVQIGFGWTNGVCQTVPLAMDKI